MLSAHRKNKYISRLMLAVVLFAQGMLAAHACVEPISGAAKSVARQQSEVTMPCHVTSKLSRNECLMHCTQSDQVNVDHQAMTALPVSDMTLHVVIPPYKREFLAATYIPPVVNTGPPLSIRYCTFRI